MHNSENLNLFFLITSLILFKFESVSWYLTLWFFLTWCYLQTAPTVQLMFSSRSNKSKAENFRGYILQAFESVLCSVVTLEIRCGTGKGSNSELQIPHDMVGSGNGSSQIIRKQESDSNEKALRNAAEGNIKRLSNANLSKVIHSRAVYLLFQ